MERVIATLALIASIACGRSTKPELKVVSAPGGAAIAHFVGTAPKSDPGEPAAPLEYGVASLYFTFPGDAHHYAFKPEGELFFSDWSFGVFSPDGSYTALLQSHYGPITVVPTAQLRSYLQGIPTSAEAVRPAPTESGIASVIQKWQWVGSSELEFQAACCGTVTPVRRKFGEPRAPQ
jgi:hypothetical protein